MNDSAIWIIVIAGAAALYFLYRLIARQKRTTKLTLAGDWLADLVAKGTQIKLICGNAPGVILNDGEELLCVFPGTTLLEPRAVRTWRGRYGGPSFRIAKGVSFRLGESRGTSESHDEMRALDHGTLVITNQRLVFLGSGRTSSVALGKVIDIEAYSDAIRLNRQGKQRVEYFQFSSDLQVPYNKDGKNQSVPLDGRMVKGAIDQAIFYRSHPAAIGRPLPEPETP
jgi:hypothetical protein